MYAFKNPRRIYKICVFGMFLDEEIQYFNDIGDLTIYNTKDGLKTVILKAETMIENLVRTACSFLIIMP